MLPLRRRVYAVTGVPPEVAAYGMAKYSRSAQSMQESLRELSEQRAADFLQTFYFQYGHRSIADMAHVALAIENISIWAALVIVDEPLWDGQERSTRYQDFARSRYHVPEGAPPAYTALADALFARYQDLAQAAAGALAQRYPCPPGMDPGTYRRTLRARALDVARYWLPLATRTSLGQVTSARVLERQISRLLSHPLPEVQAIGAEMRAAVTSAPPFNLLAERLQAAGLWSDAIAQVVDAGPVAPTLAKYTAPNPYWQGLRATLAAIAQELLGHLQPDDTQAVHLTVQPDPLDHACAALLYPVSQAAYRQILEVVSGLGQREKEDILDAALQGRGRHDEWPRELQSAPLVFDVLMDIGSFRDLNRHRRTLKLLQPFSPARGYAVPPLVTEMGLEAQYREAMAGTLAQVEELQRTWDPLQALYLLPLGARCRCLFQMDFAQAAYMVELRTGSAGHFSYREIAYQMYEQIQARYPAFARHVRAVNPREVFDPFQR